MALTGRQGLLAGAGLDRGGRRRSPSARLTVCSTRKPATWTRPTRPTPSTRTAGRPRRRRGALRSPRSPWSSLPARIPQDPRPQPQGARVASSRLGGLLVGDERRVHEGDASLAPLVARQVVAGAGPGGPGETLEPPTGICGQLSASRLSSDQQSCGPADEPALPGVVCGSRLARAPNVVGTSSSRLGVAAGTSALMPLRSGSPREYQSPAHALNGKKYHDHWLHNLQISASMAGYRQRT